MQSNPNRVLRSEFNTFNIKPVGSAFPKVFSCPESLQQRIHYLPAQKFGNNVHSSYIDNKVNAGSLKTISILTRSKKYP